MATATEANPRFRPKAGPLIIATLMAAGLPLLAAYLAYFCSRYLHTPSPDGPTLPWLYAHHAFQLLLALIAIAIVKHLVPADYGLSWPRGKTHIGAALPWGVSFGVLMTLVDYAPHLIAHAKPDPGFPLTPANVWGWLFFEGVYVGPTEEIPFRALIVTYLAATMPGQLRLGRFEMNWAGVIVALIFALLHATNFSLRGWPEALGQQVYAFAL